MKLPDKTKKNTVCAHSGMKRTRVFVSLILLALTVLFTLFSLPEKARTAEHSSALKEVVSETGNVERTDYVNPEGRLTFAGDKGCAFLVRTRQENGDVLEEYFDENAKPVRQKEGHYAVRYSYTDNGRSCKMRFLNKRGKPMTTTELYASLERSFTPEGRLERETYYNKKGNPVKSFDCGFGFYNEYDALGRNIRTVYTDENGQPLVTKRRYAEVRRIYTENSREDEPAYEYYFDAEGLPAALTHGEYGAYMEYDALGRNVQSTYLDANGGPIVTKEGYTTARRTFYADDTVETEFYYDRGGEPARLSQGQYGKKFENGLIYLLDLNGNKVYTLQWYLLTHPTCVLLVLLCAVAACMCFGKKWNVFFLIGFILAILYMTLMYRTGGDADYEFSPFWSYRLSFFDWSMRLQVFYNIWLFIPFGAILYRLYPRLRILAVPFLLSLAVEAVQLFAQLGYSDTDDIVSNTLGGAIGFALGFALAPAAARVRRWMRGKKALRVFAGADE